MRVHDDADVDAEGVAQDDVRRLAPDAGELRSIPPSCAALRRRDFSTSARQQALMFFALLLKKPVGLDVLFQFRQAARPQNLLRVRYFLNSSAVTMFTRLSVHCAERIVATSNSSGLEKFSSQCASG